jgi:hypothetical protein
MNCFKMETMFEKIVKKILKAMGKGKIIIAKDW